MKSVIETKVYVDEKAIGAKLNTLINDPQTMLQIHNQFAMMCNEYVPFLEGVLSQSVRVFPDHISYNTPYAHYQYVLHDMNEDLYGIRDSEGNVIGQTNRTRIYHPKATSYWDKAMMLEKGDLFCKQVENILKARAKKLNAN